MERQKKTKIKKLVLCKNYENGGLKMVDMRPSLKAQKEMCLNSLLYDNFSVWRTLVNYFFKPHSGVNIFALCNYAVKKLVKSIPRYYCETFKNG